MALTRIKNGVTYEVLRFPMKVMNVTQGNNEGTHAGTYAIDIAGKDTGIDPTFAPCSMKYICCDSQANGNAVWFQSKNKVLFADGSVDYATFMFIHDNYIEDIKKVVNFSQWQEFGDEGTAGRATGNHCHFEVAKGKFTRMYAQNSKGTYHLPNNISADKACVVDGVTIKNGYGMSWKKADQIPGISKTSVAGKTNGVYRIYNPKTGEHLFTANLSEAQKLVDSGRTCEGVAWVQPATGSAVYRVYNPNNGMHMLTTSKAEYDSLVKAGWKGEGHLLNAASKGTEVHRLYNPNNGDHLFTTNTLEKTYLAKNGWKYEGIAFHV